MRIYRAFPPLAKLLIPQWNYPRFKLEPAPRRRQRCSGDGSLSSPRAKAGGSWNGIWGRGAQKVRRGGDSRSRIGLPALALCLASSISLAACASSGSYAAIPLVPGAADPELQSLAQRAQRGDKPAQLELGIRYEEGRGLPVDLGRAAKLYARAAMDSGGVRWIYTPPVGSRKQGQVIPVNAGPSIAGLEAAKQRLRDLQKRLGR